MKWLTLNKALLIIFSILLAATIARGFYVLYYTRDYDYLIEAKCDPTIETCFHRSCADSPADCPPNNLDDYKQFYIKAYDFAKCRDNSCSNLCASNSGMCKELKCGDDPADECSNSTASATSTP